MSASGVEEYAEPTEVSGKAVGFVVFASVMMMLIGGFQAIAGIAAIFENEFFVAGENYLYEVDVSAWGWIHLLLGVIIFLAGAGALSGATWARVVGITLASVSAIANFFFIPYYPVWSIVIIALDIAVIWALSVYGRREAAAV